MVKEQCIFCGATFKVPDEYMGLRVKCPKCKEQIGISGAPPEELEAAPQNERPRPAEPRHAPPERVEPEHYEAELEVPASGALSQIVMLLGWSALIIGILAAITGLIWVPHAMPGTPVSLLLGMGSASIIAGGIFCAMCLFISRTLRTLTEIQGRVGRAAAQLERIGNLLDR